MVHCFAVCVCSFSRVVFALGGQEGEDASFSAENYLFFLSGNDRGMIKQAVMITVVSYLYSLDYYLKLWLVLYKLRVSFSVWGKAHYNNIKCIVQCFASSAAIRIHRWHH